MYIMPNKWSKKRMQYFMQNLKNKKGNPLFLCLDSFQEYHEKYVYKYDNKIK